MLPFTISAASWRLITLLFPAMKPRDPDVLELTASFPAVLAADVRVVQALLRRPPWAGRFTVTLAAGVVDIPYRAEIDGPIPQSLTPTQQLILACVQTRHHDGYVRQAHIEPLLGQRDEWICPFVWTLLGEYVIEIVQQIADSADRLDHALYADFLARNPRFRELTYHRAISYWNEYRRGRLRSFSMYPAFALFERFELPSALKRK
jgi:hypothetical protein